MDATAIDSDGRMTDMWDLKFGDDGPNDRTKNLAYRELQG